MGLVIFMLITIYQPLGRKTSQGLSSIGLLAASILILGQLMSTPAPTYAIDYYEPSTDQVADDEIIDFDFDEDMDPVDDVEFDAPTDDSEPLTPVSIPDRHQEPVNPDQNFNADTSQFVTGVVPIATYSPLPQESQTIAVTQVSNNEQKESEPAPNRIVTYPGVRANLKVNHWPIIGKVDADQVVICLFDYTCSHCRSMSHHLDVARQRFGSQLAVVVLPVPLDNECNPTVATTAAGHQEACELSRLALAVWRLNPDVFPAFHTYLFSENRTRTYGEAYAQAQTMVDAAALTNMVNGPLVSKFIDKHVKLYQRAGEGTLPKVLTEKMTIRGDMSNADELCGVLQSQLNLQPLR